MTPSLRQRDHAEAGRISAIDTVQHADFPNLLHVLVRTDEGLVGLGETFFDPDAVGQFIHRSLAEALLGEPATNLARLGQVTGVASDWRQPHAGAATVNSAAASALDIAIWDLRARAFGVPLVEALGGASRDRVRLYATCIDAVPSDEGSETRRWQLARRITSSYRDWTASLEQPGALARSLLDDGFSAMKVYPFVRLEELTRGLWIDPAQLAENVGLIESIRAEVGGAIDIAVDLVGGWALAPAMRIAKALGPLDVVWIEDPLPLSANSSLSHLARAIATPIAAADARAGLGSYATMIEAGGVSIVRLDIQWCGGISEAVRIASYARLHGLGVILHDCAGPVQWAASVHCALHLANAMMQESARPYLFDVYPRIADGLPHVGGGHAWTTDAHGVGTALTDDYLGQANVTHSSYEHGRFVTKPTDDR